MSRLPKQYRVWLTSWDLYDIWIDASSAEEAEAEAKRLFSCGSEDEFRHRDCGIEHVEIDHDHIEEAA
jgi:hypothetical protein